MKLLLFRVTYGTSLSANSMVDFVLQETLPFWSVYLLHCKEEYDYCTVIISMSSWSV
jgi:hypothetical protein